VAPIEQDGTDFSTLAWDDLRAFLARQGYIIVGVTLLVLFGTYAMLEVVMGELYEARASILVKLGRENVDLPATVQKGGVLTTGVRKEDLNSEIQIIRSPVSIEKVVDEIGIQAFAGRPAPPQNLFQAVKAYMKQAAGWVKAQVDWVLILTNLKKRLGPRDQAILAVQGALTVEPEKDADVISVSLRLPDPDLAVGILDRLLHHYRDFRVQVRQNVDVKPYLDAKVNELAQSLAAIERAKKETTERRKISSIAEQRALLLRQRHELIAQVTTNAVELAGLLQQQRAMRARLENLPDEVRVSRVVTPASADKRIQVIKERLATVQVERSRQLTRFQPGSDVIRNVEQEIAMLERLLAKEQLGGLEAKLGEPRSQAARAEGEISAIERAPEADDRSLVASVTLQANALKESFRQGIEELDVKRQGLGARAQVLRAEVAKLDAEIRSLDGGERELEVIGREQKIAEESYTTYVKRREEARVSDELDRARISNISVLSPPTRPFEPVSPRKLRIMGIGLAAGMVLGVALALAREYMSDVVRGAADVEREPGLPYLGTLRVEGP